MTPSRYRPTWVEKLALVGVVAVLFVGVARVAGGEVHPFVRFQSGFYELLDTYSWKSYSSEERLLLCRAIWNGCHQDYLEATYAACLGVMESHYTRKEPHRDYRKTCGYLGTHNRTAFAEVRRLHLPGGRTYWAHRLEQDPIEATRLGASRWYFIRSVYRVHAIALRQWNTGEGWKHNIRDSIRSSKYVQDVEMIRKKYFGEEP